MTMSTTTPTKEQIAEFLTSLLRDGRLHPVDIEILKAHARLPNRSGVNWQIAEAAAEGVVKQWSLGLEERVKESIPQWNQPPSWHAVDCLQRWLGHALAQRFPYYASQVQERHKAHTRRWWMALGAAVETKTIDGKVIAMQLRAEIAEALDMLDIS
jgi:hypothetical protein